MSESYQAVGWNRQKKIYDRLIAGFCLLYLMLFIGITLLVNPQATFETLWIRSSATLAVLLLHIILSIGPLTRIEPRLLPLLYNRRHLGVTMFLIATAHGVFAIYQFHSLGNVPAVISVFTSNTDYGSFIDFPFQSLGAFALVIFFLMAATSHDFWLANLHPRVWKTLHMLVYLAYLLVVMHVMLGVVEFESNPVFFLMVLTGALWLVALHLCAGIRELRIDRLTYTPEVDGFVRVCRVDEIGEDRARLFCIGQERIAVFKTNGRLFGIHNVCKHQNGPLGEGVIIDGCITCPWHGYQYLPNNGQSPPPFTEKVSTYDVRVERGEVWVNPVAYPEGTERPGAVI